MEPLFAELFPLYIFPLICTLFGFLLAIWWEAREKSRETERLKRQNLLGDWQSWWQPAIERLPLWTSETMTITAEKGKYHLTNSANQHAFSWQAIGTLQHTSHIVGEWHSLLGSGCGAFLLTRSTNDRFLAGYLVGPNPNHEMRPGPFILGRSEEDVVEGMEWLRKNWKSFEIPTELKPPAVRLTTQEK